MATVAAQATPLSRCRPCAAANVDFCVTACASLPTLKATALTLLAAVGCRAAALHLPRHPVAHVPRGLVRSSVLPRALLGILSAMLGVLHAMSGPDRARA
eukprot:1338702-Rhodomonas_salina.2